MYEEHINWKEVTAEIVKWNAFQFLKSTIRKVLERKIGQCGVDFVIVHLVSRSFFYRPSIKDDDDDQFIYFIA